MNSAVFETLFFLPAVCFAIGFIIQFTSPPALFLAFVASFFILIPSS